MSLQVLRPDSQERVREDSLFYDVRGKVRLGMARAVLLGDKNPDLQSLKGLYSEWVNMAEYLLLQKTTLKDDMKGFCEEKKLYAVPCSKRGNEIYYRRNRKRFRHLFQELHRKNGSIFNPRGNLRNTNLIFVTLTWDTQPFTTREAWEEELSKQYNRWITAARDKFGKISVVRSWESFKNGYPHVQAMLYFHESNFNVFRHNGKFRVQESRDLKCGYPSHVDIQAMHSWKGAVNYVGKYILKQLDQEEAGEPDAQNKQLQTLALCWIFRKQSYSMSRDFLDLMQTLRNSKSCRHQMMLEGGVVHEVVSWTYLGVFSYKELGIPPILKTQEIEPDSEFWSRIEGFSQR